MNAHEFTFGIEIETIAPDSAVRDHGLRIGGYKRGIQVPYLPTGWKAEADGSIDNSAGGHKCEIVSPVLRGADGINQVIEVVRTLEAKGHRVNVSCGVHVHVGWDRTWSADALARLVTIVAYVERGLYAITGTKARERSRYCGGVRKYGNQKDAKPNLDRNRYHALNLTNLAAGAKQTVEFRVFSGSLNATKIAGWIQVALGLVERAVAGKRMPKWNPGPLKGGWKKAGEGQSEAERLMGYLAWGAGYAKLHGGRQFGWISDAIPQDALKSEFRRLAGKYDAMAGPIDLRAARTAEAADGPLAILGGWAKPARLLVVRRGKPLSIGETDDGSYFGSLAGELPGITLPIPDGYAGLLTRDVGALREQGVAIRS